MHGMIPKRMHFVWLGNVPGWARLNVYAWAHAHPDYAIILRVDSALLRVEYREMYDACERIGDQAELMQYSMLQEAGLGGWMLHCDTKPMFPGCLDRLAEENPITTELLVQGNETSKYPDVWCMAATPECIAWETINGLLPGQEAWEHRIARYGAKMLRAIHCSLPGILHLADVGGYIRHEFRQGWREPAVRRGQEAGVRKSESKIHAYRKP